MSTGWLKGFSKRSWRKQLAVAVTAGILAGAYAPGVMAADYTTGITGSVAADQATFGQDAVTQILMAQLAISLLATILSMLKAKQQLMVLCLVKIIKLKPLI